ncbi:MAG: cob(I)yrinic acid a,c-diamide adenosyltransferase [Bifidobacterium adolescentis]
MKLYTRAGDDGYTGLLGEGRVPKFSLQPEAYGTVDEASSAMGVARAGAASEQTKHILLEAQRDLYHAMSELAATPETAARFRKTDAAAGGWVEAQTDAITAQITLPKEFVVPGDSLAEAYLDLARTTVRRAERVVVRLQHENLLHNDEITRYLNRLSSLLFVLALHENALAGVSETTKAKKG